MRAGWTSENAEFVQFAKATVSVAGMIKRHNPSSKRVKVWCVIGELRVHPYRFPPLVVNLFPSSTQPGWLIGCVSVDFNSIPEACVSILLLVSCS